MALLTLRGVSFSYGGPPQLDEVDLEIQEGERLGLLGRNGAGKSTLLAIVAGRLAPDEGAVERPRDLRIASLEQGVPRPVGTVREVVAQGLGESGATLARYLELATSAQSDAELERLDQLQREVDACDGWSVQQRLDEVLSRTGLDADAPVAELSAGKRRRVLVAQVLVAEPQLLLLDEPTNHLDIETIRWLEDLLTGRFGGALLMVTHDRAFLRATATRILELDRGRLRSYACGYAQYLERREAVLAAEAEQERQFDKKLSEEEAWIRRGIKARRTRNEGRVRRLETMREERRARRKRVGKAKLEGQKAERSGQLVIRVEDLHFAFGDQPIVSGLDLDVMRGDRIGLIGPNGAGKTTLLELLLGKRAPDRGQVTHGTQLQVRVFDQLREQLDPKATVLDNVADGLQTITWNGQQRPALGYLQDFLFTPARARQPVEQLSGGEKNRLLLARVLAEPANLLVLDEPTNDLDGETIELLEELLVDYAGTLLLVSHDREFLDRVVTSSLIVPGDGTVREFVGGYSDWQRYEREQAEAARPAPTAPRAAAPARANRKLSYKEQQELAALPPAIEALEQEQAALFAAQADPAHYQQPSEEIASTQARADAIAAELETSYARWEELEARA